MRCYSLVPALLTFSISAVAADLPADLPPKIVEYIQQSPAFGPDIPADFPLPALAPELIIVGGMGESSSSVVLLRTEASDATQLFTAALSEEGWHKYSRINALYPKGFIPRREREIELFCHLSHAGTMGVEYVAGDRDHFLWLTYSTFSPFAPMHEGQRDCATQLSQTGANAGERMVSVRLPDELPLLELPGIDDPSVNIAPQRSNAGGSKERSQAYLEVQTSSSMQALNDHFSTQLREQGWVPRDAVADEGEIASYWTKGAANGSPLQGTLRIIRKDQDVFDLHFDVQASTAELSPEAEDAANSIAAR